MLNERDLIKGRYRITRQLGEGGMGSVFEVYDELLQRRLALKTLRQEINDTSIRSRFLREARAVAVLEHPNILSIFDIVEEGDGLGLLMPLVEGSNVAELIAKGPVSLEEAAHIIRAVAKGLDYVHRQGIVHRDIKPSNILLEPSGRVFLADFGIAKFQDDQTRITKAGAMLGTFLYMAPEVVLAKEVSYQSDIYSLGVTAFEMLSGRAPFEGDSSFNVLSAIVQSEPPLVTDLRPDIPRETARAIKIALSKNPQDRFATAEAFVESAFPLDIQPQAGMEKRGGKRLWFRRLFAPFKKVSWSHVRTRRAENSASASLGESQQTELASQTSGGATQIFHRPESQILQADAAIKAMPAGPTPGAGGLAESFENKEGGSHESTVIFQVPARRR
ncbi:MAG: serine/threonine-protein kinase [Bryobacteraceae bacterium]